MYMIKYLKQKEYKNIFKYVFTFIASGVTGIIIFPYAITHIFFSYRGQEVTSNLLDFSTILYKIKENIDLINSEIFRGLWLYSNTIFYNSLCVMDCIKKETSSGEN